MNRKQRADLARRRTGMVFQSYHLLDDLSVAENIDLPLSYKDIPRLERQALVADTLDRFNIVGKKDLFPSQLSGGQQQLVGIARAVIHKPSLLLADEPTGNLHSGQAKEIMELFKKLNEEGTTIIQVTHSEENASTARASSNCATDGSTPIPRAFLKASPQGCNRESICRENNESISQSICEALWSLHYGNQNGCSSMLRKSFRAERNSGDGAKLPGGHSERSGFAKRHCYACVRHCRECYGVSSF
jgi:hypothetical protein